MTPSRRGFFAGIAGLFAARKAKAAPAPAPVTFLAMDGCIPPPPGAIQIAAGGFERVTGGASVVDMSTGRVLYERTDYEIGFTFPSEES